MTCRLHLTRILALIAALLLLPGCNALKLGYNNLPEVAYWWLDAYADFEDGQKQRVREDLAALHAWHRANELPRWSDLLARMEGAAAQDLTPTEVCSFVPAMRQSVASLAAQAEPALVALGVSMDAAQLAHLDRKYQRNNAEFRREWIELTPGELLDKRFTLALKRSERLYGSLAADQRARLRRELAQTPFDPRRALAQRQRRQQATMQMLQSLSGHRGSMEEARVILRATLDDLLETYPAPASSGQNAMIQQGCQSIAATHNATTPAQRATAVKRLQGWQADLRELTAQR